MATDSFAVFSAVAYTADIIEPFPLLQRHFKRLRTAFEAFAKEVPTCWCASVSFPSHESILQELNRCTAAGGVSNPQRVRLLINEFGIPEATSSALDIMPNYPIRLALDDQFTDYSTPYLRYKTTRRDVYDEARERAGATLKYSEEKPAPIFDVLLYNEQGQMTETSIANCAFCLDATKSPVFITPFVCCGLLEGVQRAEQLESGRIVEGIVTLPEVQSASKAGTLSVLCFNAVRGVYLGYVLP